MITYNKPQGSRFYPNRLIQLKAVMREGTYYGVLNDTSTYSPLKQDQFAYYNSKIVYTPTAPVDANSNWYYNQVVLQPPQLTKYLILQRDATKLSLKEQMIIQNG